MSFYCIPQLYCLNLDIVHVTCTNYWEKRLKITKQDVLKEQILKAIKSEMKIREISQSQLGKLIGGVARHHVNAILNGQGVGLQRILDMANALGLRVEVTIKKGKK